MKSKTRTLTKAKSSEEIFDGFFNRIDSGKEKVRYELKGTIQKTFMGVSVCMVLCTLIFNFFFLLLYKQNTWFVQGMEVL